MKKLICTLILILLILSLFGCSSNNDATTTANSNNRNTSSNQNTNFDDNSKQDHITNCITFSTPYDITECYLGNFIATTNDGRLYGMLDSKGNTVIDFTYDKLTFGSNTLNRRENIIYATTENGIGTIDFKGNTLINANNLRKVVAFTPYKIKWHI